MEVTQLIEKRHSKTNSAKIEAIHTIKLQIQQNLK